jgi:hypothetical protein
MCIWVYSTYLVVGRVILSSWFTYYSGSPETVWKQSSLQVQQGTPFNKNTCMSSDVHSVFALETPPPPQNNAVNGDISWPSRSPDLSACYFFIMGLFDKHSVPDTFGRLNNLQLRISEEINAISLVVSV